MIDGEKSLGGGKKSVCFLPPQGSGVHIISDYQRHDLSNSNMMNIKNGLYNCVKMLSQVINRDNYFEKHKSVHKLAFHEILKIPVLV